MELCSLGTTTTTTWPFPVFSYLDSYSQSQSHFFFKRRRNIYVWTCEFNLEYLFRFFNDHECFALPCLRLGIETSSKLFQLTLSGLRVVLAVLPSRMTIENVFSLVCATVTPMLGHKPADTCPHVLQQYLPDVTYSLCFFKCCSILLQSYVGCIKIMFIATWLVYY